MNASEMQPQQSGPGYDLIVIGGGIQGATVTLEAARRGLRPLLLEAHSFGHATSGSTLRVLHGGLRYLQSLDLRRLRVSVRERQWFCHNFPDLVRPLPCLMPLYGQGTRRRSVFRVALAINDLMSRTRNVGVAEHLHLPAGRVIDSTEVITMFPQVRRDGLRGGALWYDAVMTSSEDLLAAILEWAAARGATLLDNTEVLGLVSDGDLVDGVEARHGDRSGTVRYRAPVVINCAGPWSEQVAGRLGSRIEDLFAPALAFNLLLDRPPVAAAGVAVNAPEGRHTYFLLPWNDRILAGTHHAPWHDGVDQPVPADHHIESMLREINRSVPGIDLRRSDVSAVLPGLIPARRRGHAEASTRDRIVRHSSMGGPAGLFSVAGVKFTTARYTAEQVLRAAFGGREVRPGTGRPLSTGSRPVPVRRVLATLETTSMSQTTR